MKRRLLRSCSGSADGSSIHSSARRRLAREVRNMGGTDRFYGAHGLPRPNRRLRVDLRLAFVDRDDFPADDRRRIDVEPAAFIDGVVAYMAADDDLRAVLDDERAGHGAVDMH